MKRADTYVDTYIYGGTHHIVRDDTCVRKNDMERMETRGGVYIQMR